MYCGQKTTGFEERGRRCVVMFCNKPKADEFSPHQASADESVQRQWIAFAWTKREPNSWTQNSGHICSDHFWADNYEGFDSKIAGFGFELVLTRSAIPSIQASPTPECSLKTDFFLPPHRLAVSTLTPCNKGISAAAIFVTTTSAYVHIFSLWLMRPWHTGFWSSSDPHALFSVRPSDSNCRNCLI